jgi:osmoprotectant transport system permease protein
VPVEAMRAANYSVDRDRQKATPAEAARALEAALR